MRRNTPLVYKTACVVLVLIFIYAGYNRSILDHGFSNGLSFSPVHNGAAPNDLREGNSTLLALAPTYIHAIMNPDDETFPRLDCPAPTLDRYEYLRGAEADVDGHAKQLKYFFAIDLRQCESLLPRLLGSIVETMRFLGPEKCALSVVEGRSNDGTFEILKLLGKDIEEMGAKYFFTSSDLDPSSPTNDRIKALAELRNLALEPMIKSPNQYSLETTAIFLNDVAICSQDILELVHQRAYQKADMTCAMDWTYVGRDPTFYDVWIARGMTGNTFFDIPEDGNWNSAWNLFWNDPKSKGRLNAQRPFQVFACWNGATAFTAKPILEKTLKFRAPLGTECYQGEPKLFCKDMWYNGYGKIAVVPSVNIEYSNDAAQRIKALKGYASDIVKSEGDDQELRIEWEADPPSTVKCMPSYADQSWPAWNESL